MENFSVKLSSLNQRIDEEQNIINSLSHLESCILLVRDNINYRIKSRENIQNVLKHLADSVGGYETDVKKMQAALSNICDEYEKTERRICASDKIRVTATDNDIIAAAVLGKGFFPEINPDSDYEAGEVLDENKKTISKYMKWIKDGWVDDVFADFPISKREEIKNKLKKEYKDIFGSDFVTAYDVTQKLIGDDYIGALKKYVEHVYKKDGFFNNLEPKFYINSVFGAVEGFERFCEDPSLANLFGIGWESSVGAVFETVSDAAWDVVKFIPGVSDWYEQHGATDGGSAFNTLYTEWTRAIFDDSLADYVSSYYADNGGLFSGLVNGGKQIIDEVKALCDEHGGIVGVWLSGWNSIFH